MKKVLWALMFSIVISGCGAGAGIPDDPIDDGRIQMGGSIQGEALSLTRAVSTLAGVAGTAGSADGFGPDASFDNPYGITTDGQKLYLADLENHTVRSVDISTGEVATIAGTAGIEGSADGIGAEARFNAPYGITTDGTNLYITDLRSNTVRRLEISSGVVTTFAGMAGTEGTADGVGASARFVVPRGITTDGANLYVADGMNNTIRRIDISTREVTTLAGSAGTSGSADGVGAAARFFGPDGITTDGASLYVTDANNHTIRRIVLSTGEVSTMAGSAGERGLLDGVGASARFDLPTGITTDGTNLYVTDGMSVVRKVEIESSVVSTIAGVQNITGSADGVGTEARFNNPAGITTDGRALFVADALNNTVRRID